MRRIIPQIHDLLVVCYVLSVSGILDAIEELVDVRVVTEGGLAGYSPIAAVV